MLGNRVRVVFSNSSSPVEGELRQHDERGVWVYHGYAEQAHVSFYPTHTVMEVVDLGRVYR